MSKPDPYSIKKWASMALGSFLIAVSSLPTWGQAPENTQSVSSINSWHRQPFEAVQAPEDSATKQVWITRGNNADNDFGARYPLDSPAAASTDTKDTHGAGGVEDRYFLKEPLPVADSDAVVIATFTGYTVEASPSKRSIYSVVHFRVERDLKALTKPISPGDVLDTIFAGGSLVENGKRIDFLLAGGDDTPLEEHHRYLLFLKYNSTTDSFTIIKHWELAGGHAIAVDLVEKRRAADGTSAFDAQAESRIIAATESEIAHQKSNHARGEAAPRTHRINADTSRAQGLKSCIRFSCLGMGTANDFAA